MLTEKISFHKPHWLVVISVLLLPVLSSHAQQTGKGKLFNKQFDKQVISSTQTEEFKNRDAILKNNVFPQIQLGDHFTQQKDYANALDAYKRALRVLTDKDKGLGSSEVARKYEARIKARITETCHLWGVDRYASARKIYLDALVYKDNSKAVERLKLAQSMANQACSAYYTGSLNQPAIPSLVKRNPSFYDNIQAFIKDCTKMQNAYKFKEETSLAYVDPDYNRRTDEVKFLLRQGEVYYKSKQYQKVRNSVEKILVQDPANEAAINLLNKTYRKLNEIGLMRSENDMLEQLAEVEWKWSEPIPPDKSFGEDEVPRESKAGNSAMYNKLQKIIIGKVEYESSDIQSILLDLVNESKKCDPTGEGVSIFPPSNQELCARKISYVELEQMPLLDVIRYICEIADLKFKVEDKAVLVGVESDGGDMEQGSFDARVSLIRCIYNEANGAETEKEEKKGDSVKDSKETFVDKTFSEAASDETEKKKAPMEVSQEMLKNYFTPMGITFPEGSSISYDSSSGKILMKNTPHNLNLLRARLKEVDIPPPLVLVEAKVVEIDMKDMEELGFDWMLTYTNLTTEQKVNFSGLSSSQFYRTSDSSKYLVQDLKVIPNFGYGDHQFSLSVSIRALDQKNRSEILATPRLLVASGYQGKLEVNEERYFPDSWTDAEVEIVNGTSYTYTAPTPEFGDSTAVGTTFTVKPTVAANNRTITLDINVDLTRMVGWSDYDYSIIIGDLMDARASNDTKYPKMKMPEFAKRLIKSTVKVWDGETVVIGGILEDNASRQEDKWPILGELPLFGRFFTNDNHASLKTNLMVFVTARLMDGNGLPVRAARKQGLFEFDNR